MRRSGRLFIALGAGLALVALVLVLVLLMSGDDSSDGDAQSVENGEEPTEITIIVAEQDIPAHTVLTSADVREEVVNSDEISGDPVRNSLEVIGLAYSTDLKQDQVLQQAQVELPGLANSVDPGRRAYAMVVTPQQMLGGLIRDEDTIDILFNVRVLLERVNPTSWLELPDNMALEDVVNENGDSAIVLPPFGESPNPAPYPYPGETGSRFSITDPTQGDPSSKLILQNVRVMRVINPSATDVDADSELNYLVLDLDPIEVEVIEFLHEFGTVQIALRNPEDIDSSNTPGVTLNTLMDSWGLLAPKTVRLPGAGVE